jgi:hypothetical protein
MLFHLYTLSNACGHSARKHTRMVAVTADSHTVHTLLLVLALSPLLIIITQCVRSNHAGQALPLLARHRVYTPNFRYTPVIPAGHNSPLCSVY